jgi:competence CoiA-like predicted nuclease
MLVAKDRDGRRTSGYRAKKGEGYSCPVCGGPVIVRRGTVRIPHFAHVSENACMYYAGETELHRRMKRFICDYFLRAPYIRSADVEVSLDNLVADLSMEGRDGKRMAVECQVTPIEERELMRRTVAYSKQGVYVLWVLGGRHELDRCISRLKHSRLASLPHQVNEIEKRLHRLYYGRFYYFFNDRIYPVHMEAAERWVRGSCEGCSREMECGPEERERCEIHRPGYMGSMVKKQQITIGNLSSYRPVCIERRGGLKLARFMDKRWWLKTGER